MPAYLLCRRAEPVGDGRAVCVAGDVRKHVSAVELNEWAERLERRGILLQILRSGSRACELDADEQASVHAHITRVQALRYEAESEWAPLQREASQLQKQVDWEALTRHSCGERLREPGVRSAFRVGDIVYHAPSHLKMQHGVAVVTDLDCRTSAESEVRLSSGALALLLWDPAARAFKSTIRLDFGGDRNWMLLPPCCGRGAACPQLALTLQEQRQWPNGDQLDVCELEPIPAAFLSMVQKAVVPRKQMAFLRPFRRLLGTLMPRPHLLTTSTPPAISETTSTTNSETTAAAASIASESAKIHDASDNESEDQEPIICEDGPGPGPENSIRSEGSVTVCHGCGGPAGGRGCSWCYDSE